jgi:AMP nucleosidase
MQFDDAQAAYDQVLASTKPTSPTARRHEALCRGEDVGDHVRACYPFVRAHRHRGPRRFAAGVRFCRRPGHWETTLTRPDLFARYYLQQFKLLLKNHGSHHAD